jgi:hypothetical protein
MFPNPLGPLYSFQIFVLLGCALVFYKAADVEKESTIIWMGLSAIVYLGTWCFLGWGLLGNLLGQAGLMAVIAAARAMRDHRQSP